jgi:hypothetical protein
MQPGATMQYTFAHTGAYQIIARDGTAVDDIIVYAFETEDRRTTLAALLAAKPPPNAAPVFTRYRAEPAPEGER